MKRLASAPGLDSDDAKMVARILAELNTPDKQLRQGMLKRLKDLYVKNYYTIKHYKRKRRKIKGLKGIMLIYT